MICSKTCVWSRYILTGKHSCALPRCIYKHTKADDLKEIINDISNERGGVDVKQTDSKAKEIYR